MTIVDTPKARIQAALADLHPSASYVRVERIDLIAYMAEVERVAAVQESTISELLGIEAIIGSGHQRLIRAVNTLATTLREPR